MHKVPQSYRDKTMEWFKTDPNYKQIYEILKNCIRFKKYYPPVFSMQVDRGNIFVITNIFENGGRVCVVMDSEGNEIKRVHLPIPEQYGMDFRMLYAFNNGSFYKIEENPDTESWELFKIRI